MADNMQFNLKQQTEIYILTCLLYRPYARNFFNMTMSYQQDSDVVIKYHTVLPRLGDEAEEHLNLPSNVPRKMVVWIVSHCETPIKRE